MLIVGLFPEAKDIYGHEPDPKICEFLTRKPNPCSCIQFDPFWVLKKFEPKTYYFLLV